MANSHERTHVISIGDTLESIARSYALSGWQGLYFAPTNAAFRDRHPNPWQIPIGVTISLPSSADEQRLVLTERSRLLDRVRRSATRIGVEQTAALTSPDGPAPADWLGSVTRCMVDTTLDAIQLLKAADGDSSRSNWALARDAAQRWDLSHSSQCASLSSMLARAGEGVSWGIPEYAAKPWCDGASPSFWGKSLILFLGRGFQDSEAESLLPSLRTANQAAFSGMLRQIDSLHAGIVAELGVLSRA